METLKPVIMELLKLISFNTSSQTEMIFLLAVGFVAFCIGTMKTAKALQFPMLGAGRTSAVILIGLALFLVVGACVKVYLTPAIPSNLHIYIIPAAAVIVIFAAVIPLACLMFKSKYFQTLFSLIIGACAAALAILLLQYGLNAIREGEKGFDKTKSRNDKMEEMINR